MTTLPLPGTTRAAEPPALPGADLAAVVRLYGVRQGVEQGDKPVQQEVGWADFPVRADRAIRRHGALVCCAFCCCWGAEGRAGRPPPRPVQAPLPQEAGAGETGGFPAAAAALVGHARQLLAGAVQPAIPTAILASGPTAGAGLA